YFGAGVTFPGVDQSIRITFYADDGAGNAGAVIADYINPTLEKAQHARAPINGTYPVWSYSAVLDPPLLIEEGQRCWVSVNVNAAGPSGPSWGWMVSPWGNASATPAPDQPLQNQQVSCAALPASTFIPGSALGLDADLAFGLFGGCDEDLDCNCNARLDSVDLATGDSIDINGNGIPDECDIANGLGTDCDENGVIDEFELNSVRRPSTGLLGPIGVDVPQSFRFEGLEPASSDVTMIISTRGDFSQSNEWVRISADNVFLGTFFVVGAADCPQVPNAELITIPAIDFNEIAADGAIDFEFVTSTTVNPVLCGGTSWISVDLEYQVSEPLDCNNNGVHDACDIASGFSQDCNANGVPDECELNAPMHLETPLFAPFDAASPRFHAFLDYERSLGDVTLVVAARSDLDMINEYVDVYFNDVHLGRLFENNALSCGPAADVAQLTIPAALFNSGADIGVGVVRLAPSAAVDTFACLNGSNVRATLLYTAAGVGDCDGNGLLDSCDIAEGRAPDMNANGVRDDCERIADINGDGVVNAGDLAMLLGAWGQAAPGIDLDGDGVVNAADLAILLSDFDA
ncbi:MAG: dockerin type I domain-containing protein, partial [Planctomycetota bacterium]|nr:dockerin type I domain-containing protein [Planctomycetota bacterium]